MTVKQNATCKDSLYTDACDAVVFAVEMMNGRRDLPQGKNFGQVFNEASQKVAAFVTDSEAKWKALYSPAVNELIADAKKATEAKANA